MSRCVPWSQQDLQFPVGGCPAIRLRLLQLPWIKSSRLTPLGGGWKATSSTHRVSWLSFYCYDKIRGLRQFIEKNSLLEFIGPKGESKAIMAGSVASGRQDTGAVTETLYLVHKHTAERANWE